MKPDSNERNLAERTVSRYSFLWSTCRNLSAPDTYHFNYMQEVIPEKIIRGELGLDLGCGCGWDTYIMAKGNPSVRIVGMDISDGAYNASELSKGLNNVSILKGSAEDIPLRAGVCDFVYSFGVLHHTPDYTKGFVEIVRVLKKSAPCFLYLYEDHSENMIKYLALKLITAIRKITVRIPPKALYFLCSVFSPLVFICLSLPSRLLSKFKSTAHLAKAMPFNFAEGPFALGADLYDRFSAPIEYRFSREEVYDLFAKTGFSGINITRLKDVAGWAAWGYKK